MTLEEGFIEGERNMEETRVSLIEREGGGRERERGRE